MATVIHTVQEGETLQRLSVRYLYDASRWPEIKQCNNLTKEELYKGQTLRINTDDSDDKEAVYDTVGLEIDGTVLVNVPGITLDLAVGAIAPQFKLTLPNEEVYRNLIKPFEYQEVKISYRDKKVFTGLGIRADYSETAINLSGYGTPGVLATVTLPRAMYPRTLRDQTLEQIAKKYCRPFGVKVVVEAAAQEAAKKKFVKTAIEQTDTIGDYLIGLAKQRGCILTSDEDGACVIAMETEEREPVLDLEEPMTLTAAYDGDKIFSDYYAIREGNRAHSFAEAKKQLNIKMFRHTTIQSRERGGKDPLTEFVESEVGRTLIAAMQFDLSLPYVTDANGDLFAPREVVRIVAPRRMIAEPTLFEITGATLSFAEKADSAKLTLAPADAMGNQWTKFW